MTRATWDVLKWWELRRIPYTIVVAGVGALTFFTANSIFSSGEDFLNPAALLIGVPLAVIAANVFYTLGWVVDLVKTRRGHSSNRFRAVAFYSGLVFSVAVMASPLWLAVFSKWHHP